MHKKSKNKLTGKELKKIFLSTVPVLTGYIILGISFGVILRSKGFGVPWALGMSVFIYAGSMQFAAIPLMAGGASVIVTALTTLAVNARHLFYGISMIEKYKGMKPKPFLIFGLTDETYSLVCNDDTTNKMENRNRYYFLVTLFDYAYWVTGSVLGSLLGSIIPFSTKGIDFALTALFVTVFVEQWKTTKNHLSALTGVGVSLICLILLGSKRFLIPAMIIIMIVLTLLRNKEGVTND